LLQDEVFDKVYVGNDAAAAVNNLKAKDSGYLEMASNARSRILWFIYLFRPN
jgi:hypothetical protein